MTRLRYRHDCPNCTYLKEFGDFDLYFCTQTHGQRPIVLARYGDEKEEEKIGVNLLAEDPEIIEALKCARDADFDI